MKKAVMLLVFQVTFRLKKVDLPGPPWPLASNPLIAHCEPLVALLNGACTIGWAITVGKQPVKYGKLQSHHEHISAFIKHALYLLFFSLKNTFHSPFFTFLHLFFPHATFNMFAVTQWQRNTIFPTMSPIIQSLFFAAHCYCVTVTYRKSTRVSAIFSKQIVSPYMTLWLLRGLRLNYCISPIVAYCRGQYCLGHVMTV